MDAAWAKWKESYNNSYQGNLGERFREVMECFERHVALETKKVSVYSAVNYLKKLRLLGLILPQIGVEIASLKNLPKIDLSSLCVLCELLCFKSIYIGVCAYAALR